MKKLRFAVLVLMLLLQSCSSKYLEQKKQREIPEKNQEVIRIDADVDKKYQYLETVKKPVKLEVANSPSVASWAVDRGKLEKLPTVQDNMQAFDVDLRGNDISHLKIGKDLLNDLKWASFSTTTKWPQSLPKEFNPAKVLEEGKNPGLKVRTLHERGITGDGIGIAIIDQNLLVGHEEYKDQLKFYEEIHTSYPEASMHGPAVASIAVGKTVGVAHEADLYYIAEFHGEMINDKLENDFTWLAISIDRILEVNKTLPNDRKIRVISISVGWSPQNKGFYETEAAVNRAKEQGVFVVSSTLEETYGFQFHGLGRTWNSDYDDPATYLPGSWWSDSFYENEYSNYGSMLMVPMDGRTTADPSGNEGYVYYSKGGWSWSIPYIAGLYALHVK